MAELNNIKVSIQEKNEIKKDSPDTLPLNPTAQGFSGQEVRRRLSKSLVGEKGSLLSLVIDKMEILSLLLHSILDESDDDSIIEQLKKKISKDGSVAMEGDLDLGGNDIDAVGSILFEQGGVIANLDGNDFTIRLQNGQVFKFNYLGLDLGSKDIKNARVINANIVGTEDLVAKVARVKRVNVDIIESYNAPKIDIISDIDMSSKDIKNAKYVETDDLEAYLAHIKKASVDIIESNDNNNITFKSNLVFEPGLIFSIDKMYVKEIHKRAGSDYIPIFSNIDMGGGSIYTIGEIESELGVFNSLTKGGKEVATLEYVDQEIARTLKPMGNWNASTNTPTLLATDIERANQVWYVNVAGTQFGIEFDVNDELVYNINGEVFRRDNVDAVTSIQGKKGAVTLVPSEIGAVEEALNDGKVYARKNKRWVEFQTGFLPDEETITLNGNDELEATNVAIWRYS